MVLLTFKDRSMKGYGYMEALDSGCDTGALSGDTLVPRCLLRRGRKPSDSS